MSLHFTVRPAEPGDAEALTRLAEAVSAEPEAWLISADGDWRSVGDERRYLKAVRRYPHAAVYVAERSDGAIIGRLSLARDTHPASSHVADLGLMVAVDARRRAGRSRGQAGHPDRLGAALEPGGMVVPGREVDSLRACS